MANYNNFKRAFEHYLNNVDMITKVVLDDLEDVGEITSKKSGGRKSINRGDRRRATALNKKRMKSLATYSVAEIRNTGKVKNYGEKHYFKGAKAWSRKVRHEVFSEPMPEEPVVELTVNNDGWRCRNTASKLEYSMDEVPAFKIAKEQFEAKKLSDGIALALEVELAEDRVYLAKTKLKIEEIKLEIAKMKLEAFKLRNR